MLRVRWRIWLERDGTPCFGDGRARLLRAVAETGSISEAARRLGMSYRNAWQHVKTMEKGFGRPLVERRVGGSSGGGCRLTADGRRLLDAYRRFRDGVDALRDDRFRRCLAAARSKRGRRR